MQRKIELRWGLQPRLCKRYGRAHDTISRALKFVCNNTLARKIRSYAVNHLKAIYYAKE